MSGPTPGLTVLVPAGLAPAEPITTLVARLGGGRLAEREPGAPDGPAAALHLDAARATEADVIGSFPDCWIYRTAVHVVFDRLGGAAPATARTVPLQRNPVLDHQGFVERWTVGHAALARRHHPGIGRYVQRVVVERLTPEAPPGDGIACLAYRTHEDLELRQYDSPEGQRTIQEDVAGFLDKAAGLRVVGPEADVDTPDQD